MTLNAEDQQLVRQLFEKYVDAWDVERDPKACADLYEHDGDCLAADGEYLGSPQEIEQYYIDRLGGAYKDFRVGDVEIFSIREIRPGVAILDAKWNLFRTDESGARAETVSPIMGTIVCSKADAQWSISAARVMVPQVPGG